MLALGVAAVCLPGIAWAGSWTHEGTYGAATIVSLPGGQAMLARDGADLQARTIVHTAADGSALTIVRAYGPSARKAVEIVDGTVRQHVYGAGLAPLLHIEGDGSLIYQVGADAIGVDAAGLPTVAHRAADIKRSTVAYDTLGAARPQDGGDGVYAKAAQLAGYEGLSVWQLGTDQMVDNRARVYAPAAGRFLALDALHKARAYEARGNDWITRADYDGMIDDLMDALENNTGIAVGIGEHHDDSESIVLLMLLLDKLDARGIDYVVYSEDDLLVSRANGNRLVVTDRIYKLGIEERVQKLVKDKNLKLLSRQGNKRLTPEEGKEARRQAAEQDYASAIRIDKNAVELAASLTWNVEKCICEAEDTNKVAILYTGAQHLQKLPEKDEIYYDRKSDGIRYNFAWYREGPSFLQPVSTFDLVFTHKMVGLMPRTDRVGEPLYAASDDPHLEKEYSMPMKSWKQPMKYILFAPHESANEHPALKPVFGLGDDEDGQSEDDEKKENEDDASRNAHGAHGNAQQGNHMQKRPSWDKEESKEH